MPFYKGHKGFRTKKSYINAGKEISKSKMGHRVLSKTKQKISKALKDKFMGKESPHWKGGHYNTTDKYIRIYSPKHPNAVNKSVLEHRLIIEKQIGRYLHRWEVSHHINKIKDDNRPENLMAFKNNIAHKKFEAGNKINPKDIIFDGRYN